MKKQRGALLVFLCLIHMPCASASLHYLPGRTVLCGEDRCDSQLSTILLFNAGDAPATVSIRARAGSEWATGKTLTIAPGLTVELEADSEVGAANADLIEVDGPPLLEVSAFLRDGRDPDGHYLHLLGGAAATSVLSKGQKTSIKTDLRLRRVHLWEIAGTSAEVRVDWVDPSDGHPVASQMILLQAREVRTVVRPETSEGVALTATVRVIGGSGSVLSQGASGPSTQDFGGYLRWADAPAPVPAAGPRRRIVRTPSKLDGSVSIRLTMPVPEGDRAGFEANRAILESRGFVIAQDTSSISFPTWPPGGWIVDWGGTQTAVEDDGRFTVDAWLGGPSFGRLYDPSTPQPLYTISRSSLAPAGTTPSAIVVDLPFLGPCHMNTSEAALAGCNAPPPTEAAGVTDALMSSPLEPLITYPTTPRASFCEQLDGFISSDTDPLLAYFGSTCHKRVVTGCCPNEGGWGVVAATICCVKNHKGRYCQEVTPGEIEILTGLNYLVDYAETIPVTVHNNGCRGETDIKTRTYNIGGGFSGPGFKNNAKVVHYDENKLAAFNCKLDTSTKGVQIWIGDRTINYTTPPCSLNGSSQSTDVFVFTSDSIVQSPTHARILNFQLRVDNLYKFANGLTFSLANAAKHGWRLAQPDQCPGIHVHGLHPCTGVPDLDPSGCGQGQVTKVGM